MRHEMQIHSPTYGTASVVLLAWDGTGCQGAYINFERRGLSRLEAMQQGSELIAWVDSLVSESAGELPFDWVLVSSELSA